VHHHWLLLHELVAVAPILDLALLAKHVDIRALRLRVGVSVVPSKKGLLLPDLSLTVPRHDVDRQCCNHAYAAANAATDAAAYTKADATAAHSASSTNPSS